MVDPESLQTASLYINNQLVSRGLLRDGQTIDFAHVREQGPEAAEKTAGRIISIVNDLILRRDRDAQHLESLSGAMRKLRAENAQLNMEVDRLSEKNTDEQRRADVAMAAETAARAQVRTAESNVRSLKEDMGRMRALVAQTRATCATEVRRRDRQNDALKKQLVEAGRWRGARANPCVTTIQVTDLTMVEQQQQGERASTSTRSENYNGLECETNTFLAKLAQELSEENEALLELMGRTTAQLREMSGFCHDSDDDDDDDEKLASKRPGCRELSAELESVMAHMRTILTNPSFVPIEEVVLREEEIDRLKAGWLKMESRWKEAIHLLDGWRRRMAASGRLLAVEHDHDDDDDDDDELSLGLRRLSPERVKAEVGLEIPSTVDEEEDEDGDEDEMIVEEEEMEVKKEAVDDDGSSSSDEEAEPEDEDDDNDDFVENWRVEQVSLGPSTTSSSTRTTTAISSSSPPLPSPPQLSPLKPPRPSTNNIDNNNNNGNDNGNSLQNRRLRPRHSPSRTSLDEALLGKDTTTTKVIIGFERDAKLRAKIEEARRRACQVGVIRPVIGQSLSEESSSSSVIHNHLDSSVLKHSFVQDARLDGVSGSRRPLPPMPSDSSSLAGVKRLRKRAKKPASRRRSTLSQRELEALLSGGKAACDGLGGNS
ncbi:hypothetical protein L249_0967 [Ophiocordyceps polyrhachis-furcata BCC 54312]|uniref:NIMA interactive protein n=1 Tax=Ophiocordyceps polyrhachis-furcata BCC 54312 TaxID=1330021 RepID=A0A367LCK9_9HYPO|nr:hypothetical protein L249_0967 [Ophiocordyceps polyrhachis-furcata BCC 54312]